jgi:hypothetical protein
MKFEVTRLAPPDVDGEPLSYRLYRMAEDPSGLVVLLPGVHYGPDGPLLFYPAAALREMGWDTLQLTYRFQRNVSAFDPGTLEAIGTPLFDPYFARTPQPAQIVLGTSDRFYDEDALDRLRLTRPYGLTLVEGADHAMVIPGDLDGSIRVLRRTTREVVEFCLADDG